MSAAIIAQWHNKVVRFQLYQLSIKRPAIKAKTIDENVIILITQQPVHNRLAENQPTAGLSSLNEYENEFEFENGIWGNPRLSCGLYTVLNYSF